LKETMPRKKLATHEVVPVEIIERRIFLIREDK
jgi:hypothetical protein